jgi:peptidoglycan/xylan/chitin deacetylase (PgdA/CDA1 family)
LSGLPEVRASVKKTLLKAMYSCGAFAPFHWANRRKVLILTYHCFSSDKEFGKVSAIEFRTHLEYLKKHNRVLPLSETIDHLKNGKTLPANTTVITIDDGYADGYDVAFPLLKQFGFPATVYAITDFVDAKIWLWTDLMRYILLNTKTDSTIIEFGPADTVKADLTDKISRLEQAGRINARLKKLPNEQKETKIKEIARELDVEIPAKPPTEFASMNWDQAREMDADNIRIESHTVTHPILTNVGQATLDFEMTSSKARLEEVLERPVGHFCYPNGSLDKSVQNAAKNAGYASAVTTAYGFNDAVTDQFSMNRIDAQGAIESFAQSASGFEAARQKILSKK